MNESTLAKKSVSSRSQGNSCATGLSLEGVQPILGSDERTPGWLGIQIPETSHIRRERIGREARAHVMLSFEDYHLLRIWSWDLIN